MHISKFNLLSQLENVEQNLHFITVDSEELLNLHNNTKMLRKYIFNNGLSQLERGLETINRLKSACASTTDSYSNKLSIYLTKYDWQEISNFFNILVELDFTMENLSLETFEIINKLKNDKIKNPLREKLIDIIKENKEETIAVVANFPDLNFKEEYNQVAYLKPVELVRKNLLYDVVIFIGTPYLYEKFDTLFLGKEIIYLSYSFYNNKLLKRRFINSNSKEASTIYENLNIIENDKNPKDIYEETTVSEIEKMSINRWIEENKYEKSNKTNDNEDLVSSKIIQLENHKHYVVFPDTTLKVLKIQRSNTGEATFYIRNSKLKNINKKDWIILKKDTEEEYLIKRSKEIYGESFYDSQMELIKGYKRKLKEKKRQFGSYEKLLENLNKNKIRANSTMVIKNWVKDTIRPRNLEAILKYLRYSQEESIKIIAAADFINKSHVKVGMEMGKRLTNYLKKLDVPTLEEAMLTEGEYEFNLDNIGTFKVESVKNILDEEMKVNRNKLYKIINTNEEVYYE